ncbi:MAG: hypothetical protein DRH79_08955 [Candidatus Cloacimonadota bacterium]|nr:MAG: hypothetical protein DRH79_08955 [Candidatus Cloacimonadota bacterium]
MRDKEKYKTILDYQEKDLKPINKRWVQLIEKSIRNYHLSNELNALSEKMQKQQTELSQVLRTKINLLPSGLTEIRVVKIGDLDLQADGGTHVKNTSEIGTIKIVGHKSNGRINKKIKIQVVD